MPDLVARLEQVSIAHVSHRVELESPDTGSGMCLSCDEPNHQWMRAVDVLALCRAWQEEQGKEEISVCKRCKHPVRWHLTRLLYDCTNCGRIDGSAMLLRRADLPAAVEILFGDRQQAEQGWQPIETAPKDGTKFLALHADGNVTVVQWDDSYNPAAWATTTGFYAPKFTVWMPVPAAPIPTEESR